MIDLQRFFEPLFLEKDITHSRLTVFAKDNEANMIKIIRAESTMTPLLPLIRRLKICE